MRFRKLALVAVIAAGPVWSPGAGAEDTSVKGPPPPGWSGEGKVVIPESSVPKPGDAGQRSHTNTQIFVPITKPPAGNQPGSQGSGQQQPAPAEPPR
jgi:hypothetical protein